MSNTKKERENRGERRDELEKMRQRRHRRR